MSHYTHLTIEERECLLRLMSEGKSIRAIAKEMGRSPSTIGRELARNRQSGEIYSPFQAEKRYHSRRKKCCARRRLTIAIFRTMIRYMILEQQWSPEQISNRLKLEKSRLLVSYSTIYRAIYNGDLEVTKLRKGQRGLAKKLRHHGKRRHKKGIIETRGKFEISHSIDERPQAAQNRSEFGHWEADTVLGKSGGSCLITTVDRKSRYLKAMRVSRKTSSCVGNGLITMFREVPQEFRRSITPDRGKEFSSYPNVSKALEELPFYFPNPHAPWERGSNENTNGLIREYCPKSVDMNQFSEEYVKAFVDKLNHRPRKCLGWRTPHEVLFDETLQLTEQIEKTSQK